MKKYMALSLGVLLLFASIVGCANSGGGDTTTTAAANTSTTAAVAANKDIKGEIKYWTHSNNTWNASQDRLIALYEANNSSVKVSHEAFPYGEFEAKTQTSLLAGEGGADVYEIWGGWAIDFAPTGALAEVPGAFMSELKEDVYDPVIGAFEYEGKYYGVPLEFNNEYGGMLVLKPYFQENNLSYPKTWDEMIDIAKAHSVSEGEIFDMRGFDFVNDDSLTFVWLAMILSKGGQYYDGESFKFNTPIGIETMQHLADYVVKDKLTNVSGGDNMEGYQRLYLGEALIAPRGPWVIPEGVGDYDLVYGEDYEYIEMPFYGSDKVFAAETGWGLAVNSASKNLDAAWDFVEFFLQPENILQHNIECGQIPPSRKAANDPKLLEAMPFLSPIIPLLDKSVHIGYCNTDILKQGISEMFYDICVNGTPVEEALAALDARFADEL